MKFVAIVAAFFLLIVSGASAQVTLQLDPNDHRQVLVSNVPANANHLHFYEASQNAYPASTYKYVDLPPSTTSFRPASNMPWVDVAAMPTTANGTPIDKWYSDVGGRVLTDPNATPGGDTTPPDTTITSGANDGTSTSATFSFTSSEANSTFSCSLDGASGPCTSPKAYSGLGVGTHTFAVSATDAAGNQDLSPATDTWTISAPPPPPPTGKMVGVNAPWLMGWGCSGAPGAPATTQFTDVAPDIVRDPAHCRASWDFVQSQGKKVMPQFDAPGDVAGGLAWMQGHPAFSGVVELSNEPFWATGHTPITPEQWVSQWGPVIDQWYSRVKLLAPIDDWPTAHDSSPGTAGWTQRLIAAKPDLKTKIYGWAIHPYCDSGSSCALSHLQNGINALKANGVASPRMWATEWGWSRGTTTEATQASNAQSFLNGVPPELEASMWYQMNDNNGSSARENGFGLFKFATPGNWCCWNPATVKNVIKQAAAQ